MVRRGGFAQKPRCYVPVLAAVGDDRDRFLVVASDYPNQRRPTFRLKRYPVADLEVEPSANARASGSRTAIAPLSGC